MTHLVIGPSTPDLGRRLAAETGYSFTEAELQIFPDGESCCRCALPDGIGSAVIVQGTQPPQDRHLQQLMQLVDHAAARGASDITCVVPYLAYSRQDRRMKPDDPLSSQAVLRALAALGMTRLVTIDVHNPRIFGYCDSACTSLSASEPIVEFLSAQGLDRPVLVSPDEGGRERIGRIAARLGWPVRICSKNKDPDGRTWYEGIEDGLTDCDAVVIDDLCSSGSTLLPLAEQLYRSKVRRILFGITHFFADADALAAKIGGDVRFFSTNSIPSKVSTIDLAPLIADHLRSTETGQNAEAAE